MLIQCTKKLLDQLKIKPEIQPEEKPLFSWHANVIVVNRKKTVVLVNDLNRYVIVLHGLKAKDFKKLDELIVQGIRETFRHEGISDEVIEKYLSAFQEMAFTKTKDRTCVARMNKACENVEYFYDYLESETIFNTSIAKRVSSLLVGDGKNRYITPNKEMYQDLEAFAGQPIFHSQAVELKVTLKLEAQQVWRRVVVPLHQTFPDLHEILQVAFGWEDDHLHEFTIYENHGSTPEQSNSPVAVTLVALEEALDTPNRGEMRLEKGVPLSDYLPAHKKLLYTYDMGDNWEHVIEIEKIQEDYDLPHAICVDGEGNAPPEDVGGSHGYTEFLNILANPQNPDYQHMLSWGRSQGYEEFDIKKVNRLLSSQ